MNRKIHDLRRIGCRATSNLACLVMMAMALMGGACRKEKAAEVKPEEVVPINPEAPANQQESARIAQSTAIFRGIEPPPPTRTLKGGELATPEVLAAYNQELLRYMVRTKDVPETLSHLMRTRELPRLPTAPAGQHIVYDPATRSIKLERR